MPMGPMTMWIHRALRAALAGVGARRRPRTTIASDTRWFEMSNEMLVEANLDGYFMRLSHQWERDARLDTRGIGGAPLHGVHPSRRPGGDAGARPGARRGAGRGRQLREPLPGQGWVVSVVALARAVRRARASTPSPGISPIASASSRSARRCSITSRRSPARIRRPGCRIGAPGRRRSGSGSPAPSARDTRSCSAWSTLTTSSSTTMPMGIRAATRCSGTRRSVGAWCCERRTSSRATEERNSVCCSRVARPKRSWVCSTVSGRLRRAVRPCPSASRTGIARKTPRHSWPERTPRSIRPSRQAEIAW